MQSCERDAIKAVRRGGGRYDLGRIELGRGRLHHAVEQRRAGLMFHERRPPRELCMYPVPQPGPCSITIRAALTADENQVQTVLLHGKNPPHARPPRLPRPESAHTAQTASGRFLSVRAAVKVWGSGPCGQWGAAGAVIRGVVSFFGAGGSVAAEGFREMGRANQDGGGLEVWSVRGGEDGLEGDRRAPISVVEWDGTGTGC